MLAVIHSVKSMKETLVTGEIKKKLKGVSGYHLLVFIQNERSFLRTREAVAIPVILPSIQL